MVSITRMHFKGYLQMIHKIKKLKEGFVRFKYFTDPKKQMKDCTNIKYLDLNSNTHKGRIMSLDLKISLPTSLAPHSPLLLWTPLIEV